MPWLLRSIFSSKSFREASKRRWGDGLQFAQPSHRHTLRITPCYFPVIFILFASHVGCFATGIEWSERYVFITLIYICKLHQYKHRHIYYIHVHVPVCVNDPSSFPGWYAMIDNQPLPQLLITGITVSWCAMLNYVFSIVQFSTATNLRVKHQKT